MAMSSSFTRKGKRRTDQGCFASFRNASETDYVIIEPEKQFYSLEYIEDYFSDLREMGFEFTHVLTDEGEIHIFMPTEAVMGTAKRKMLLMAIRYLWEGQYVDCSDHYQYIIETYTKLKNYKYMSKYSKLQIMCIAHNLGFIIAKNNANSEWYAWCSNHQWCHYARCKLLNKLPDINHSNINQYCSQEERIQYSTIKSITQKNVNKIVKRMES